MSSYDCLDCRDAADQRSILLDDEMRLKITDFGSAKLQSKDGKDGKEEAHAGERARPCAARGMPRLILE